MSGDRAAVSEALSDVVARLRRAMRRSARVRMPGSLSVAQLELLSTVQEHGEARPGELARRLRLAPNSVSTLTNTLVTAGMLRRTADPRDGRAAVLELTEEGLRQVLSWRDTNSEILAAAVDRLSVEDRRTVEQALPVLSRLVAQLDTQTDEAD